MWSRLAIATLAGCSFQHGQVSGSDEAGVVGDGRSSNPEAGPGDAPVTDARPPDAAPAVCPSTYTLSDPSRPNSKYRSVTASSSWAAAQGVCAADAALPPFAAQHLIVLDNDAERAWAFSINNSDQWVGMSDTIAEGAWVAVTNQPNPYVGAAMGNLPAKDCMMLNNLVTLAEACSATHPYLCECDGR